MWKLGHGTYPSSDCETWWNNDCFGGKSLGNDSDNLTSLSFIVCVWESPRIVVMIAWGNVCERALKWHRSTHMDLTISGIEPLTSNSSSWALILKESLPSRTVYSACSTLSLLPLSLDTPRLLFLVCRAHLKGTHVTPAPPSLQKGDSYLLSSQASLLLAGPVEFQGPSSARGWHEGVPLGTEYGGKPWGKASSENKMVSLKNSKVHSSQVNCFF